MQFDTFQEQLNIYAEKLNKKITIYIAFIIYISNQDLPAQFFNYRYSYHSNLILI